MALATFGVTQSVLETCLKQYELQSDSHGSDFSREINYAASQVSSALRHRGVDPSDVNVTDYPEAYYIAQDAVCLIAAGRVMGAFFHHFEDGGQHPILREANKAITQIKTAPIFGEIQNTGGQRYGDYSHGDTSASDMKTTGRTEWDYKP